MQNTPQISWSQSVTMKTVSLFDTGATISCMPKACFDKLDPKPNLMQTQTYKVNGANGQWQQSQFP